MLDRHPTVVANRSAFTEDNTAGPSHSRIPATAAVVFPDRDGPTSATAPRSPRRRRSHRRRHCALPEVSCIADASVATNIRPNLARTNRPDTGSRTSTALRSLRLANRVRASTPSGRRRAVPTLDREIHRATSAIGPRTMAALTAVHTQYKTGLGSAAATGSGHAPDGSPAVEGSRVRARAAAEKGSDRTPPLTANASQAPNQTAVINDTAAPATATISSSKLPNPSRSMPT